MGVLVREVGDLSEAFLRGKACPLPELPIQYADYAVWQREWLKGEVIEQQLAYWKQELADVAVLEMPTDHVRPATQSYRGAHVPVSAGPDLLARLKQLAHEEGVTLFMVLLAGVPAAPAARAGEAAVADGTG